MREIKFRGKRIGNGEWVKGWLYSFVPYGDYHERGYMIKVDDGDDYEVDPETVGQYTGLKDKNGKEIYEGDILKVTHEDGDHDFYKVEYQGHEGYPAFDLVPHLDCDSNGLSHVIAVCVVEVIGNIYEHPHLLKEV